MIAVSEASERERLATIQGLADGLVRGGKTLQSVKVEPATPQAAILAKVLGSAIAVAMQDDASVAARTRAAAMLVHIPFAESKAAFEKLLASDRSDLQLAAIRSLRMTTADEVPGLILKYWKGYTPAIRGEAINVLTSRSAWSSALLDAIANKVILLADLSTITKTLLVNHRDAKVRERAVALMGKATTTARAEVLANYKPALDKKGDATRGLAIFKRECASCHFAGGVGTSIGPAIAAIGTRTPDALLTAILDPNREVDPRYLNYTLFTTDERTLSGIITAETATSVTLRRADGVDIVMRSRIEELRSSGVSLMPEGVEKNITIAEMGDLLAFLATVK
jgi:putative heme-binding domain-containing protein